MQAKSEIFSGNKKASPHVPTATWETLGENTWAFFFETSSFL
jgi:hypothetical protein